MTILRYLGYDIKILRYIISLHKDLHFSRSNKKFELKKNFLEFPRPLAASAGTAAQQSSRGGSERGCGGRGRRRYPPACRSWELRLRA